VKNREDTHKLLSTAGLLMIDAMIVQEVISSSHKEVATLSQVMQEDNVKRSLEESWDYITKEIDYEPMLVLALRILRNLPVNAVLNAQLKSLCKTAYDIASSKVLLRHDLFGRIYHTLLLGNLAKYHATYYTSIPAARLLARLLVNLPSPLSMEAVPPTYGGEPLRVVDFACGSGTLLSAVYKELDAKHRIEGKGLEADRLHRYLVEDGIWGFDVLLHATHLASTTLFLQNPISVDRSRLYALRLGVTSTKKSRKAFLGSIDFLNSNILYPYQLLAKEDFLLGGGEMISMSKSQQDKIDLPNFHVCIMNPPFTRSVGGNLLFGSLPPKERTELQKVFGETLKKNDMTGIGQAGLGAAFVFLADKRLVEGGRLGLVLPRAVLTGVSWRKVREKLLGEYDVEYIITSYEPPNGWNFSENTDLSEVLLVAKKTGLQSKSKPKPNDEDRPYTIFVNLWKKPSSEIESIYIGSQLCDLQSSARLYDIENSNASPYHLKLYGRKIGEVYAARLTEDNFGVYNLFSQMEINRVVALLRKGILYLPDVGVVSGGRINLTSLKDLGAEIGPDRRQVHSTFKVSDVSAGSFFKAFWGYDSEVIKRIAQGPNRFLEPKNAGQARDLWKKAGNMLIVERARLNTYTVLSVNLTEPVLSNVWWPIKLPEDDAKILSMWFNSTFGGLLLLSIAEVTCGPWVDFKKEHLLEMPVLDTRRFDEVTKGKLISLYDRVSKLELKSLPDEYKNPETKRLIDEGINDALGLGLKFDDLYRLLAAEPMITGK